MKSISHGDHRGYALSQSNQAISSMYAYNGRISHGRGNSFSVIEVIS